MSISAHTFAIPDSRPTKHMTVVYYNDRSIPKGLKAFFRLDPRIHERVKCRVKIEKGAMVSGGDLASVRAALHTIARQHDYNWPRLLEAAKRGRS